MARPDAESIYRSPWLVDGVLRLDTRRVITEVSVVFQREFGVAEEDLVGQRIESLFDPRDRTGRSAFNRALLAAGDGPPSDLVVTIRVAERSLAARLRLRDADPGWHAFVEELRADRASLYQAATEGERWKSVGLDSTDGIAMVGDDGRIMECNWRFGFLMKPWEDASRVVPSNEAVVGRPLREVMDQGAFADVFGGSVQDRGVCGVEGGGHGRIPEH